MCVREGEMQGTTTQSCRCWHSAQRAQWGGRRKDGARTAHFDPWTTLGSCSVSEEPQSGPREEDWTCTSLGCSCWQIRWHRSSWRGHGGGTHRQIGAVCQSLTYLVRDLTPVTGELVVWFPLPTEPESLLNGGLQYVVRFAPLLPPAIVDTPTAHLFQLFWWYVLSVFLYLFVQMQQARGFI